MSEKKIVKRTYGLPESRERVLAQLEIAFAENRLDLSSYEQRLDLAHQAESLDELEQVVHDFPSFSLSSSIDQSTTAVSEKTATRLAVIGDQHLDHDDFANTKTRSISIIGDVKINLKQISSSCKQVLVPVYSFIGDITVIVPRGMRVKNQIVSVIGDFKVLRHENSVIDESLGVCVIKGFSLIGDIVVREEGSKKKGLIRAILDSVDE